MTSQTTLLGAAGEYYVMSELLRRNYIAALAPVGVPNTDIIVTDIHGHQLSAIQVKARREVGNDGGWHMGEKHERIVSENLFYCLVDFGRQVVEQPKVFVIPSVVVASAVRESHAKWLVTPGKKGQPRKDSSLRRLRPDYDDIFGAENSPYPNGLLERYRGAWDLLGDPLPTANEVV